MAVDLTTVSADNSTLATEAEHNRDWWLPLAIALPVCIVGITLITILVIVIITCYKSKFMHKTSSGSGQKLNDDISDQNEAGEDLNEARNQHNTAGGRAFATTEKETGRASKRNAAMRVGANISSRTKSMATNLWNKAPWKQSLQVSKSAAETGEDANDSNDGTNGDKHAGKENGKVRWTAGAVISEAKPSNGKVHSPVKTGSETPEHRDVVMKINGEIVPMRKKQQQKQQVPEATGNANNLDVGQKTKQLDNRKTFVVMYPTDPTNDDYLSLAVNDVIYFMEEEQDGWMKGEKKESGEVGWFPRSHVREGMSPLIKRHSVAKMEGNNWSEFTPGIRKTTTTTTPPPSASEDRTKSDQSDNDAFEDFDDDDDYETGIECRALYPYRALEEGDINFDAGDIIVVVEKQDNGWWRGYRGDEQGFFPGSYVQLLNGDDKENSNFAGGELLTPTEDVSRSVAELLPVLSVEEEEEDGADGKKKKNTKSRKSLGLFLMSIPRKMASTRTGGTGGPGNPGLSMFEKAKKGDRSLPWVKKKKQPNLPPMKRRSSLAPGPPQNSQALAEILTKNIHEAAADTARQKRDMDVTYEELNYNLLEADDFGSVLSPRNQLEINFNELKQVELHPTKAKENAKSTQPAYNFTDVYANLDSANSVGQKQIHVGAVQKPNKNHAFDSIVKDFKASANLAQTEKKPVPPKKPNLSGSTPDIAQLLKSHENQAIVSASNRANKPQLMAKPKKPSPGYDQVRISDDLVAGTNKPKPLTAEKPRFLLPGFPEERPGRPNGVVRRLSLGSVKPRENGSTNGGEEDDDLGIMRWLQKKLSQDDDQVVDVPTTTIATEPATLKLHLGNQTDSGESKPAKEDDKIVFEFKDTSRPIGLSPNEESFV